MKYELIENSIKSLNPVEQVLLNRGIKQENIAQFLNPSDDNILDPLLLRNMKEGAKMLLSHIERGDKVFIQVDADCDGYTSAAALINYLNHLFPHFVQTNISYRVHDGKQHGLLIDTIPTDVKLVIAPDASSNDIEVHDILATKGIDVLVLDHHTIERESQNACVINNQWGDYPNKTLSGAGVVYKFCCYLDSLIGINYAEEIADLVTVGIQSDVMLLTDLETRAIITKGMNEFKNPLLKTMVEKDKFHFEGKQLSPFLITWYIAPYINAISRSGTLQEKQVVFESMIDFLAYNEIPSTKRGCSGRLETRVEQAVRTCNNVKNRQTKEQEKATEVLERIIEEQNLLENKILAIKVEPKYAINKNLTGLCANRLLSAYNRPVLVLNYVKNEEYGDVWAGSGRGYDKGNLGSFREAIVNCGLAISAVGHSSAFGASIPDSKFDEFINYFNELYKDFDCDPIYKVDYIFQGNDISWDIVGTLAQQEVLWGRGVEAPIVAIEGFKVFANELNLYGLDKGKPTLNIRQENGCSLVKFKSSEEEYEKLHSDLGYVIIDAVGTCEWSNWGNCPQIYITDYEIVGRQEYYF